MNDFLVLLKISLFTDTQQGERTTTDQLEFMFVVYCVSRVSLHIQLYNVQTMTDTRSANDNI